MFLQVNDFLLVVFQCNFDLGKPFLIGQYTADANRVGHGKQQRKMLIMCENRKIKVE